MAIHPTNPVLITGHHCGTVNIWNIFYQQIVAVLHEHQGSVRSVKIHPYGDIFVTGGDDKVIRVWNYKTKQVIHTMKGHTDYIRSLDFHPTKPWVVSGSDDGTIKVWNYMTGEMLSNSSGHTHYVMAVLFLDSNHIISASLDHTIGVWNCANLFEKKKFMVPDVVLKQSVDAHDRGINSLSMWNSTVVSGGDDREIKIWKYHGDILGLEKVLYNHDGNVTTVFTDGETFNGGGEDSVLSSFSGGRTTKIDIGTRLWTIAGRGEYLAVGTDDGLVVFRASLEIAVFAEENAIFFTLLGKLKKFNMNQSIDITGVKNGVVGLFIKDGIIYVSYEDGYELLEDGKRVGSDLGSVSFVGNDRYHLKGDVLYKNDEIFRSDIVGKLIYSKHGLFVINGKTFTFIHKDQEYSLVLNFQIKTVTANDNYIAVIGTNRVLLLDYSLSIVHTINELVEITGGIFHEDIFIYATVKQLKYFLEEVGVLQSIDSYMLPAMVKDDYLFVLGSEGVEKILLNMSEIRFRRAVINDENILGVIEEEQLPGLSPLEYLVRKNKGGIALPFIKDDEKRFKLFISDGNYEEALKLCANNKMYEDLALEALKNGAYDISEICFRKLQDHVSLFYLFLSTNQLSKMKDLEGENVENMVKVIFDDASLLKRSDSAKTADNHDVTNNLVSQIKNLSVDSKPNNFSEDKDVKSSVENDSEKQKFAESESSNHKEIEMAPETTFSGEKGRTTIDDVKSNIQSHSDDSNSSSEKSRAINNKKISTSNESSRTVESDESASSYDGRQASIHDDDSRSEDSKSDSRTDLATCNSSELQSQIFDLSEIDMAEEDRGLDAEQVYRQGLELTTEGKFTSAIESFRMSIALFAQKMTMPRDFIDIRRKIGSYLLGLHIEKMRKNVGDPNRSIEMILFFSTLDLEEMHIRLVKNLALTTCFKYGNYKTAYEIAEKYPECKNAKMVLNEGKRENKYEVNVEYLCYDTLTPSSSFKECALCEVKSTSGELCKACVIGILH